MHIIYNRMIGRRREKMHTSPLHSTLADTPLGSRYTVSDKSNRCFRLAKTTIAIVSRLFWISQSRRKCFLLLFTPPLALATARRPGGRSRCRTARRRDRKPEQRAPRTRRVGKKKYKILIIIITVLIIKIIIITIPNKKLDWRRPHGARECHWYIVTLCCAVD